MFRVAFAVVVLVWFALGSFLFGWFAGAVFLLFVDNGDGLGVAIIVATGAVSCALCALAALRWLGRWGIFEVRPDDRGNPG